jgi:hypothetical protein
LVDLLATPEPNSACSKAADAVSDGTPTALRACRACVPYRIIHTLSSIIRTLGDIIPCVHAAPTS